MKANIKTIPSIIAVEMPHGLEAIPTAISGRPVRFTTVDSTGMIMAWATPTPPELDGPEDLRVWVCDEVHAGCSVGFATADGDVYSRFADSLRRIDYTHVL